MEALTQTRRNTNGILDYLRRYLDIRFSHANRINHNYRNVEADLKWHQLEVIDAILMQRRAFGAIRIAVADILASFDVDKKKDLYSRTDQNSIMSEILTGAEENPDAKAGSMSIRDIASLYRTIDPALKPLLELMQTWIWWDIPDAVDMHLFDGQIERLTTLSQTQLNDKLVAFYREVMKGKETQPLTIAGMLTFEFNRATRVIQDIEKRRADEGIHAQLIARESNGEGTADTQIVQLSQHVRALERLRESSTVDPSIKDYYVQVLKCAPEELTAENAIEFEYRHIQKAKHDLAEAIREGDGSGAPYNFKLRELESSRKRLEAIKAKFTQDKKPQQAQAAAQ